ncbi:PID-CTERM protein-sorting domain-containing protein [Pedobacter sp. JCM 36344]|uniref:PID-CTERM protein-sorting domain-containing protein n=1 Tax=Pedobacter sp. JCM 36344 TaxID=3374280 RepID=UPI00397E874D
MKTFRNLFSVLLILSAGVSRADDPGLPGGDPDVPIDGGIVILLVAGVYYGVQKIRGTKEEGSEIS